MTDPSFSLVTVRGTTSYEDVLLDEFELESFDRDRLIERVSETDPTEFLYYGVDVVRMPGLGIAVLNFIFPDSSTGRRMKTYYDTFVYRRVFEPFFDRDAPNRLSVLAARRCRRLDRRRDRRTRRFRDIPSVIAREIERN